MRLDTDEAGGAARLLEIINANWMTQAAGAAAELRIADVLAAGPADIGALAAATACDRASLHRLMRALASLEICAELDDGSFEITPMGSLLGSAAQPTIRSWAVYTAGRQWGLWGRLHDSVKTGESARKLATGREGYAHLEDDPQAAALFNRAMVEITGLIAGKVAQACDFSAMERVVDVGGGYGELLIAILEAHPHLHGTLFDLPHAIEGARKTIDAAQGPRCELVCGSFFESIPSGADAYLMKSILHNWDDERCSHILANCRRAMPPHARLLVVERIMPERISGSAAERAVIRSDLNMLVALGGRERTLAQFAALLTPAGFAVKSCKPVGFGFSVLEGAAG